MILALLQLATAVFPWGVAQSHLCLERPGLFILEWGEHTTQRLLGLRNQHHVAQKRLDGSEEGILLGGNNPSEETREGTTKKKERKKEKVCIVNF